MEKKGGEEIRKEVKENGREETPIMSAIGSSSSCRSPKVDSHFTVPQGIEG